MQGQRQYTTTILTFEDSPVPRQEGRPYNSQPRPVNNVFTGNKGANTLKLSDLGIQRGARASASK